MQVKKLRKILKYAYENVAFYHQKFNKAKVRPGDIKSIEDLHKIPVLTKSEVQKNFRSLIAKGIEIERCIKETTSGSTGIPLTVVAEKNASHILVANKLRHYVENGGDLFRDKFVLLGQRRKADERTQLGSFLKKSGIFRRTRICIQDPLEDVFGELVSLRPDVVKGYPSFLLLLAREIEKRGNLIHPRCIWSNGELLDARSRKRINLAFETETFDGYGCTEAGYIAWECTEHAGYHIDIDLVVTEFVKDGQYVDDEESGEVIVTPLWNYAMPLIRYRVGDIASPSKEHCPCGRGLPLMNIIEGRFDDCIVLPSGRIISPLVVSGYFENIEGIAEYRIIQERKDNLIIQIVPKEEYEDDMLLPLRNRFAEKLGAHIRLNIEIVDHIPTSDKLRRIVSKCLPREQLVS